MDIRFLRTFVVTARTLSFRRAAEQLFMAQPTVTQHVRLLEEELRTRVFDRSSRRVRLTPSGERFLEYAKKVLATFDQGVQEVTGWEQGYRERLVLAASPLVARSTLPRVMKRFTAEHPDIEVVVRIALSHEIAPLVAEGQAHVGLSRAPAPSRDLERYIWYTDPVVLVVPRAAGYLDAPPPDWKEVLSTHRLLTHNHPVYWDDLLLAIHNLSIRVRTMEVSLVDITKRFIEEGLGVSFLPESTVREELAEGRLLKVPTPGLTLPEAATYVVTPVAGGSEAAQAFTRVLRALEVDPG